MYILFIRMLVLGKLQFVVFLLQEKMFLTLGKSLIVFVIYDLIMVCNVTESVSIAVILLALLWPRR